MKGNKEAVPEFGSEAQDAMVDILDPNAEWLQRITRNLFIARLVPGEPFWLIDCEPPGTPYPPSIFDECDDIKRSIIAHLLEAYPQPFLLFHEPSFEGDGRGVWRKTELGTWIVPRESGPDMLKNMTEGEWFLYWAKKDCRFHVDNWEDWGVLRPFMEQQDIVWLLSAWKDNDPWYFACNPKYLDPSKA